MRKRKYQSDQVKSRKGLLLKCNGLAEVNLAFRSPAALFADEFGAFNEFFEMGKVLGEISHIFHIAQMLIVFRMRHLTLLAVSGNSAHFGLLSRLAPAVSIMKNTMQTPLSIIVEFGPSLKNEFTRAKNESDIFLQAFN